MGTYYKMICRDCKERCNAASTSGIRVGGVYLPNILIDSHLVLPRFLMFHLGCRLESVIEGHDDAYDESFQEWDEVNVEEMEERPEPWRKRDPSPS